MTADERTASRDIGLADGRAAECILSNPYWKNWPNPAPGGDIEEIKGAAFVDGWAERFSQERTDKWPTRKT